MNAVMEKSSETSLEKAFREKPVSVYNVNFTPVVYNFTEKRFLPHDNFARRGFSFLKESFFREIIGNRRKIYVINRNRLFSKSLFE